MLAQLVGAGALRSDMYFRVLSGDSGDTDDLSPSEGSVGTFCLECTPNGSETFRVSETMEPEEDLDNPSMPKIVEQVWTGGVTWH